ncbi:MAG: hypothetical protein HXS54_08900 [Theionarchaea archaeon]|nr:hypothetical protein [Theionarchaea archaeon]
MIDRLPRCLHTCFNCVHAVLCEEYKGPSRKIVFEGCWKTNGVTTPVDRENCDRFEESPSRMKRSFWKKWKGCIYVVEKGYSQDGKKEFINYESFRSADNLVCEGSNTGKQYHAHDKKEVNELPFELPTIDELPLIKKPLIENPLDPPGKEGEQVSEACQEIERDELTGVHEDTTEECEKVVKEREDTVEAYEKIIDSHEKAPAGHDPIDTKSPPKINGKKEIGQNRITTRSLILQALSNGISRLKDIAYFADIDPSTAHYHLRNLVKELRVIKISWGEYQFSDSPVNGQLLKSGRTFEKLLKNFSHSQGGWKGFEGLHPLERNILMDILSKENKYEQYSERELARRSNISRYAVKKYTQELEKKKLIMIKRENNQLVFTPTEVAIKGVIAFFTSLKTGSKIDSSSSKVQPLYPGNAIKDGTKDVPVDVRMVRESHNVYTPSENVLETFDDYLVWQKKNAHRLIIQFKLLRCSHPRLKGSGWIFGRKSIHKHFTTAYIYKSKDPGGDIINVLPKNPFIFMSPFEFEDQIVAFVNEIIEELRDYGIVIDLSEPAEIKLQHEAIEDDPFARKVIEKGLLYFESKVVTLDANGELMKYVIKIDKSKSLHLEFEGSEAHHLTENLEAFVDDVITGRIDRKKLRELPSTIENLKKDIEHNMGIIEDKLTKSINHIEDTQKLLHQNQLDLSENLVACMDMVQKIGKASESVAITAHTIMREVEFLTAKTQGESGKCSYLSHCS